jgi:hypothetical protein
MEVKPSGFAGEQPPYRSIEDKDSVCLVDVPSDETQCAEHQSAHGTGPVSGSVGPEPTHLGVLMQQARAMEAMADTLGQAMEQNERLMNQLMGRDEVEEEQDHGLGTDMAGRPIRVTG